MISVADALHGGRECEIHISGTVLERYRSGYNEAVLKTVCPQGRMGSNPILSVLVMRVSYDIQLNISFEIQAFWRSTQEAEGTPLERVQVVNSGARVQIPPSPYERLSVLPAIFFILFRPFYGMMRRG